MELLWILTVVRSGSIMVADGVVSMYVNGEIAFTTRMYMSQGSDWGVFSIESKAEFTDLKVCK